MCCPNYKQTKLYTSVLMASDHIMVEDVAFLCHQDCTNIPTVYTRCVLLPHKQTVATAPTNVTAPGLDNLRAVILVPLEK